MIDDDQPMADTDCNALPETPALGRYEGSGRTGSPRKRRSSSRVTRRSPSESASNNIATAAFEYSCSVTLPSWLPSHSPRVPFVTEVSVTAGMTILGPASATMFAETSSASTIPLPSRSMARKAAGAAARASSTESAPSWSVSCERKISSISAAIAWPSMLPSSRQELRIRVNERIWKLPVGRCGTASYLATDC